MRDRKHVTIDCRKRKHVTLNWPHLVLTGEGQVLDLHLLPASSREEDLVDAAAVVGVHDGDGTPISAHPEGVPPDGEAGDGEEGTVVRDRDLHLWSRDVCAVT